MFAKSTKNSAQHSTSPIQAKAPFFQRQIKIGNTSDPAEMEADRAADAVLEGKQNSRQQGFFSNPPPPPAINKKSQDQEEEQEVLMKAESPTGNIAPAGFAERLSQTTGGQSLDKKAKSEMEGGLGADFSNVRVHTDSTAAELSQSIGARAFTYGNQVFFNQGQYNPQTSTGKHLLAHELTHTIQQGASPQPHDKISRKPKKVQRGLLDRAWGAVTGAIQSASEWVEDQLSEGIEWVKEQATNFVSNIPGFSALTVALGKNPITGAEVARNGTNFLRAGLDLIPGGDLLERKMREIDAMEDAIAFLDAQLATIDLNLGGISSELSAIWNSLGIGDVRNPRGVLQRVANVFTSRINQVVSFASSVGKYFLQLIKRIVIRELALFVKNRTRAYPLMSLALGFDVISGEGVDQTPEAILKAVFVLFPNGEQRYNQLQENGALAKALAYMASVKARAFALAALARANALAIWETLSIESLMEPTQTFIQIFNLVAEPVAGVVSLVASVILDLLNMMKDALLGYLGRVAARVPGFTLLTVILGKNPLTGKRVARTPQKLLQGFFELIPGGSAYFKQLQASGAIDRMIAWVVGAIAQFLAIGTSIIEAFQKLWKGFSWADLVDPLAAFGRVISIVRKPVGLILAFVADVVKQLLLVLLQIMKFPVQLIQQLIVKVTQAIGLIKNNPIAFLQNLLRALQQGFMLFFDNILTHLLNGVSGWLFGQLSKAGITPPKDFSFKSIFGLVIQILGITMENIWQKIVKKIGPEKAARLQRIMNLATGVWAFVKDVMTRGPAAMWEYIQNKLSDVWSLLLHGVKNWVITKIIQKVTTKLLSLFDPTGIMAVVNSFIAVFNAIQSFIEQFRAMLQLLNSLADGVIQIALGNVALAAQFVERSLGRAVPIMISFLANQIGLSGLGKRVGEMIGRVREIVDKAIDSLIDKAWKLGAKVLEKGKSMAKNAVKAITNWAKAKHKFTAADGSKHSLYVNSKKAKPQLMVASKPTTVLEFLSYWETRKGLSQKKKGQINTARNHYNSKVEPILEKISESENKGEPEERRAQLIGKLLKENAVLSMYLRDIIGSRTNIGNLKERYALEGTVGRYSSSAEGKGDEIEADHQPQNAVLEYAANLNCFSDAIQLKRRAAKRSKLGFAINLHMYRHRAGRTYGRSVDSGFISAVDAIDNSSDKPAMKRRKVIGEIRKELNKDADTINKVVKEPLDHKVWKDLHEPLLSLPEAEKLSFQSELKSRIHRGEDQMKRQPLDHLVH